MEIVLILALAIILDLVIGEPPAVIHPVIWMGKVIAFLIKGGKGRSPAVQFAYGLGLVLITVAVFSVPVYVLLSYLYNINLILYIVVGVLILKTSFSLKELRQAALRIRNLLQTEKLEQARFELRALVGRDTSKLDTGLMVSAIIESVAENICDSFFAPLFYFAFLGVAGAVAYRVINTLDAMIGHHGEFEYLGKFAARLDTFVNFIPARLAALVILFASWLARANIGSAWHTMLTDNGKTESPNAGWTMSAMAGALGVQLEKVGYYKLGQKRNPLVIPLIDASLNIVMISSVIWCVIVMLVEAVYHVTT
jgi:adenosylcobinamide-phosphate synthase